MSDDLVIAEMVRRLRRDRKVTQAEVAASLRLPQSVVSRIDRGERRLTLPELRLLCALLGLDLLEFVAQYLEEVKR